MSPTGAAPGHLDAEVVEELHAPRADEVAAGLVAGEARLVDERHPGARPGPARGRPRCRPDPAPTTRTSKRLSGKPLLRPGPTVRACRAAGTPAAAVLAGPRPADPNRFAQELFTGLPARYDLLGRGPLASVRTGAGGGPWSTTSCPAGSRSRRPRRRHRHGRRRPAARRPHTGPRRRRRPHRGHAATRARRTCARQGAGRPHPARRRVGPSSSRSPTRPSTRLTFTYLLRYVADPAATLRELARVVKPGAPVASLEFHVPPQPVLAGLVVAVHPRPCSRRPAAWPGASWFDVGRLPRPQHLAALPALPAVVDGRRLAGGRARRRRRSGS